MVANTESYGSDNISPGTENISDGQNKEDEIENRVTFFPPLHDDRRAWILSVLRREKVSSVSLLVV